MYVALTHISVNLLARHEFHGDGNGDFALPALTMLGIEPEQLEEAFGDIEQEFTQLMDIAEQLTHAHA
jgi:hypothetical protein